MQQKREWAPRLQMARAALRPLVRCLLRGAHSYQDLLELIKFVFVEVAAEELAKSNTKINASRLSIMTGVHRKDVTKILEEREPQLRKVSGVIHKIIGQWEQDRRFCAGNGKPRVLSFEGENSDFTALVRSVTEDYSPGTVLFELERHGTAERTKQGLKFIRSTAPMEVAPELRYDHLGKNIEFLIRAAEDNLFSPKEVLNLNIRTEYDNISKAHLPKIRLWLHRSGKEFHHKVRTYLARYDFDVNPKMFRPEEAGARVVVGGFTYTEANLENTKIA